jgi:hypothetical protein
MAPFTLIEQPAPGDFFEPPIALPILIIYAVA